MTTHSRTVWVTMAVLCRPLLFPEVADAQWAYNVTNGAITITRYSGPGGSVAIPPAVNGLPVIAIGPGAFVNSAVTAVTIPDSVVSIGAVAFGGCDLTNICIPRSVTSIGDNAFSESQLTTVSIPSTVTAIGGEVFYECSALTSATIGSGVTGIGDSSFYGCWNLTNATIGPGITSIGHSAFASCPALTGAYFQGDAPSADSTAFDGDNYSTIYYRPGANGWGPFFAERPTAQWNAQADTSRASLGARTNGFGFAITGASNLVIVVEACTNLANPSWSPLQTMTLTGEPARFADPQWSNYPARFYRVHWP